MKLLTAFNLNYLMMVSIYNYINMTKIIKNKIDIKDKVNKLIFLTDMKKERNNK